MKTLFIILDGLGDRPYETLGWRTPLEAARTPSLDRLAECGITGVMYPFGPGIAPSSDRAHFRLFGYTDEEYCGRGYLEALGEGYEIKKEEVAVRTSFVTVEESEDGFLIISREVEDEERLGLESARAVADQKINGIECRFHHTGARQGLLILSGGNIETCDSDPLESGMPVIKCQALDAAEDKIAAEQTAAVINEFMLRTAELLKDKKLNFLVTKWSGQQRDIPSFYSKTSLKGAIVAEGPLYKGMAKFIGMGFHDTKVDGTPGGDLSHGFDIANELLANGYDFVHVHSKVPDKAGHAKDPEHKKAQIELLDSALSGVEDNAETLVVITGDHATPSAGPLIHSGEAVPILMAGASCGSDGVTSFGESACRLGHIGTINGCDVMPIILNLMDRSIYHGLKPYPFKSLARPTADRITPLTR